MKVVLSFLAGLHVLPWLAVATGRSLRSPLRNAKARSHTEQHTDSDSSKLVPWAAKKQWAEGKHHQRTHMLAHVVSTEEEPVPECIACFGVQVVYGKYQGEDGDQTANSYYLFRNPAHKVGKDEHLPIIVQFHHGSFFSGAPWKHENSEIKSYLDKGFAVVSVGYRLVTEKYFYEAEDGENKTEELINISEEGRLSLDKSGKTMESYKVRIGKQEFITKCLYDATQMMESLIQNADKFGLDIHRIVFVGESTGGAPMQYLTWVYHQWHVGRYTPRGMTYNNAQLNYPVHNMLDDTWGLFVDTMGAEAKLSDVVSKEACPIIIGNHMCGSPLGEASDYELCNHVWNKKASERFCGAATFESATLGEVQEHQRWPNTSSSIGMRKLWSNSENMQNHLPHDPFYIYVSNTMNGTRAEDVAHHSVFALNFAKFGEMGKEGGIQYTVYYTDFAHMDEQDRGMQRLEVSSAPGDLGFASGLALPEAAIAAPVVGTASGPGAAPGPSPQRGPSPVGPAPAPAPAPAMEMTVYPVTGNSTLFNYLSTHNWREGFAGRDVEAGSTEERILYACMIAGVGPFKELSNETKTQEDKESGATQIGLSSLSLAAVAVISFLRCSF